MESLMCAGEEEGDVWAEVEEDGSGWCCRCVGVICYVDSRELVGETAEGVDDCPKGCPC